MWPGYSSPPSRTVGNGLRKCCNRYPTLRVDYSRENVVFFECNGCGRRGDFTIRTDDIKFDQGCAESAWMAVAPSHF